MLSKISKKQNVGLVVGNTLLILAIILSSAMPARAFYQDEETTSGNMITAGAVAIETSLGNWDNAATATDFSNGDTVSQVITVDSTMVVGNGDFLYRTLFDQAGAGICSDLFVVVLRNGQQVAAGALGSISPTTQIAGTGGIDTWTFTFSPLANAESAGGICDVRYAFEAFEVGSGMGAGFYHRASEVSVIYSAGFGGEEESDEDEDQDEDENDNDNEDQDQDQDEDEGNDGGDGPTSGGAAGLVINEIAADAIAEWGPFLGGKEWVEIYNNGANTIDLAGWIISEYSGSTEKFYTIRDESEDNDEVYTMLEGTTIAPGEFRVVIFVRSNVLNNGYRPELGFGERVALYAPFDYVNEVADPVDVQTIESAVDTRSDGLVVDGVGEWVKTERTPNQPNIAQPEVDEDDI